MTDDGHRSGAPPTLVLHKNKVRGKRPKASGRPLERQAPEFQMIDCRPNLYESFARTGAQWRSKRLFLTLREWLFVLSAKIRWEPRRENNDN